MATERRIRRLKDMVDRIERLPASEVRDRILSEVRSRAVDVDTGVTPRAMLPVREPAPPVVPEPARPRPSSVRRPSPLPPAPAREPVRPAFVAGGSTSLEESLQIGDLLSLDD